MNHRKSLKTLPQYSYIICKDFFEKFFQKLEAKARRSLLPRFDIQRTMSFSFELWKEFSKSSLVMGLACTMHKYY